MARHAVLLLIFAKTQKGSAMPSFDIVSKTDLAEVDNAVQNASREMSQRYDFKNSASTIALNENVVEIFADDDLKLRQVQELLQGHLAKRKIDVAMLDYQKAEPAAGQSVRQKAIVKQGIDKDLAKSIVKAIKGSKLKVQVSIQGDELRVSGKKRDDLQSVIQFVKDMKLDQPTQYVNFRD
jgi:uncharacterized protein YajQ (UPF0234 family)